MDHLSCKSIHKGRFLHFSGEIPARVEKTESTPPMKSDKENLNPQRTQEMDAQIQGRIARTNENRKIEEKERQEMLPDIERQMNEEKGNTHAPNTEKASEEKLTSYGTLKLGTALGYRSDTSEGKDLGSDEWIKDHTGKTPKGSLVMGVMHLDKNNPTENDEKAQNLLTKMLYKKKEEDKDDKNGEVIETAMNALKAGKTVTFLAEGAERGLPDREQRTIAEELDKQFPGQIIKGTWDNKDMDVFTSENKEHTGINIQSGIGEKLAQKYGATAAEAGLWAMMRGEKEPLKALSEEAERFLQDLGIGRDDEDALNKASFPESDSPDKPALYSLIADVTNDYNRLRQENILQMVNDIESEGGIAIVTPGASHAYSLKGVVEGHMEDIKK